MLFEKSQTEKSQHFSNNPTIQIFFPKNFRLKLFKTFKAFNFKIHLLTIEIQIINNVKQILRTFEIKSQGSHERHKMTYLQDELLPKI